MMICDKGASVSNRQSITEKSRTIRDIERNLRWGRDESSPMQHAGFQSLYLTRCLALRLYKAPRGVSDLLEGGVHVTYF